MRTLKNRLAALEAKHDIAVNNPVMLFDDDDPARIERAKASGRMLILISESYGYEIWANGQLIHGEIKRPAS